MGDIHGKFKTLSYLIRTKRPELVIQLGDFGYWPELAEFNQLSKFTDVPVWFIDGNHENYTALNKFQYPIFTNCLVDHVKRGEIRPLPNGMTALFMGGAYSIDKDLRTPGLDWFPEETIKGSQVYDLPVNRRIDVIFSHTCPQVLYQTMVNKCGGLQISDPSTHYLQMLLEKYSPKLWYFSHWHTSAEGSVGDMQWKCIDTEKTEWLPIME